jgi:hypothetical protein
MKNPLLGSPGRKVAKGFGSRRPTYQVPKLLSVALCMVSNIDVPNNTCPCAHHGGQSCQEIRQFVRRAFSDPEWGRMRRFGLGFCFPWKILQENTKTIVLADYNGSPIVRLTEGKQPWIVHPAECISWTGQSSFFPVDVEPDHKDAFVTAFLLAAGFGLVNEIFWRSFLSDFGTLPLPEWVANYRTYGRGTYCDFLVGT